MTPRNRNEQDWGQKLRELEALLPGGEPGALAALNPSEKSGGGGGLWRSPIPDHEREHLSENNARPSDDDPQAIRRVGIIGGGTAGYLTALAIRKKRPWLEVTLVESSNIPVIGVGEATTPPLTAFLHHYLGIDPQHFIQTLKPTWKLGIKFDWGPYKDGFMSPFDWGTNSIGVLGSMATQGDPNAYTLQSLFMMADRVPVFKTGENDYLSLMDTMPFAYHLENRTFVKYLKSLTEERGIHHIDAEIDGVEVRDGEWVKSLHTKDGQKLEFDLYFDCTGFRSLLLGKTMGTKYISFEDSLYNDTAITGYVEQTEAIEPYTRATTMDAGWCWRIPVPGEDHIGYVHASRFLSEDKAMAELAAKYKDVDNFKTVRFRSGRHEKVWRGNVIGMGNSYGFVEPLESSALLMLVFSIMSMMPMLPTSWKQPSPASVFNRLSAERWDGLRWFLAIHFKFNNRLDTKYWREVQNELDVSGVQPMLDAFAGGAPLGLRDSLTRRFVRATAPTFYELAGVDTTLLGQGYPCELLKTDEPLDAWRARKKAADALVSVALTQRQALEAFQTVPELTTSLMFGPHSWVTNYGTEGWLKASRA